MRALFRFVSLTTLALRRLIHQRALTACLLLGMTMAVALAAAIPAYVNVAQAKVLREKLQRVGIRGEAQSSAQRQSFGLLFTYISTANGRADAGLYDQLNDFVNTRVAQRAVLPTDVVRRTMSSDRFRVYPAGATVDRYKQPERAASLFEQARAVETPYLFFSSFDAIDGIENEILYDDGRYPGAPGADGVVEAIVERGMANKYGIAAGDTFSVAINFREQVGGDNNTTQLVERFVNVPVRITGVWTARDASSDFWTLAPTSMRESMVVREEDLRGTIMRAYPFVLTLALWNVQLDANELTVDIVDPLVARAQSFKQESFQISPDMRFSSPVVDSLIDYRRSASELTLVLTVFSMPAFAMVVYFLALIAGMVVRQQLSELAILQSRGSSSLDIFGLYLTQGLVLGVLAFGLGLPLGLGVAGLIANTRSFLEFSFDPNTFWAIFRLNNAILRVAVIAAVIGVVVTLVPALGAAGRNILTHGVSRARDLRKPFWQRAFLDVLLLAPCVYGYFQLRQRGSLATVTQGLNRAGELGETLARLTASDDPFRDPVRFLLPVLTVTALGLLAARLLPYIVSFLARVIGLGEVSRGPLLPVFLALRELGRSPGDYIAPLVLLIFTLGVAIFGASAARTLDRHLLDTTLLNVGGDTLFRERGESNKPPTGPFGAPVSAEQAAKPELFNFPPIEDHYLLPGVEDLARISTIAVAPQVQRTVPEIRYTLYALDRRPFHRIAQPAFRPDYASQSFGDLMNTMGRSRDGLLASRKFLLDNGLAPGDELVLKFALDAVPVVVTYTVRGDYLYFPVAGTDDVNISFVADIDYTFEQLRKEVPYDVLLKTAPGTDGRAIAIDAVRKHDVLVSDVIDQKELIGKEQARPERQGMFGMLSASFVFVTLLTLTGFAVYALLSFKRRSIEIGVMRAMGLSGGQMAMYVIFLQTFVVILGAAMGGLIGLAVSALYVPFLQIGGSLIKSVPPFFVRLAYEDTLLFYSALGIALVFVLAGSLIFLRRLKVFEVVKLGGG
jgi:putative ABC transport system permease protein